MKKQQLQEDLKNSMKARDELKTSTLRMLISAIGYFEIQKGGAGYTATDEDIQSVIQSEARKRKDAIEQYTSANRLELAEKETKELKILQAYLPEQMNEDEVRTLVQQAISTSGASTPQDMGKVMGVLMPQVKGKADGGMVSRLVREELSG